VKWILLYLPVSIFDHYPTNQMLDLIIFFGYIFQNLYAFESFNSTGGVLWRLSLFLIDASLHTISSHSLVSVEAPACSGTATSSFFGLEAAVLSIESADLSIALGCLACSASV